MGEEEAVKGARGLTSHRFFLLLLCNEQLHFVKAANKTKLALH